MPPVAEYDRREQPRHPVRAHARMRHEQRGWDVHLMDMSFNGARLAMGAAYHSLSKGDEVSLTVELGEVRTPDISELIGDQPRQVLRLRGTLMYSKDQTVGVEYRPISEVDQFLLTLLLARPEE